MAIKDRINKIQGKIDSTPRLNVSQWFQEHMDGGETYDANVAVGFLLALNEIIEKPLPHIWARLEAYFHHTNYKTWTECQQWIFEEYQLLEDEDEEAVEEPDGDKELRAVIALTYYWTYQGLPKLKDKKQRAEVDEQIYFQFIRPLMTRAHFPSHLWSIEDLNRWFEKQPGDDKFTDDYDFIESLRSHQPSSQ